MPNLSSRSKHVEFESNSTLQIRNQKKRRAEKAEKSSNFAEGCKNFAGKISHGAKFSHCVKMLLHFLVFFFAPLTSRLTSFL